jgi:Rrf2 family protein
MLSLTKKTDYALISLGFLAENHGRVVSAREISHAFSMPDALVMNILKTLHHHDWLRSTRGTKGGYQLAIKLGERTVLDLIEALEGPVSLTECMIRKGEECRKSRCRIHRPCPIEAPIKALHNKLVHFLKETPLSDVVVSDRKDEKAGRASTAR